LVNSEQVKVNYLGPLGIYPFSSFIGLCFIIVLRDLPTFLTMPMQLLEDVFEFLLVVDDSIINCPVNGGHDIARYMGEDILPLLGVI